MKALKRFFARLIYWLTHPHKATCSNCCLYCTVYNACRKDTEKQAVAKKYYCNGKNGICDTRDECENCEYFNGEGGHEL